jgi:hypothetical protein
MIVNDVEPTITWVITTGKLLTEISKGKGKAIPLQALTGPEGSSRLRLPDFKKIGTRMWQRCQPYAQAAFIPTKYSWY